jgi:hypothetical protein
MVKKLLQQRKRSGQIEARHAYSGRKPLIVQAHEDQMRVLLARKLDMTLKELREALGLDCSLPAIHYVLTEMGLTYKKRHSALLNTERSGPIQQFQRESYPFISPCLLVAVFSGTCALPRRSSLLGFLLLASQLPNVQQICHPQSSIGRIRGTLLFSGSLRLSQTKQLEQRLYLHPQSRLEHQL